MFRYCSNFQPELKSHNAKGMVDASYRHHHLLYFHLVADSNKYDQLCKIGCGLDLAEWLESMAIDANVATVLGSI